MEQKQETKNIVNRLLNDIKLTKEQINIIINNKADKTNIECQPTTRYTASLTFEQFVENELYKEILRTENYIERKILLEKFTSALLKEAETLHKIVNNNVPLNVDLVIDNIGNMEFCIQSVLNIFKIDRDAVISRNIKKIIG